MIDPKLGVALALVLASSSAVAAILGTNKLELDFTKPDIAKRVSWTKSAKLKLGKTTTDLTLSQPLAPCGKKKAGAAAKKPKTRKLWGDGSGSFRTRGQYSAATVRGTRWLVQDSCAGTLTKVTPERVVPMWLN